MRASAALSFAEGGNFCEDSFWIPGEVEQAGGGVLFACDDFEAKLCEQGGDITGTLGSFRFDGEEVGAPSHDGDSRLFAELARFVEPLGLLPGTKDGHTNSLGQIAIKFV
jgi:hypothetical protein